MPHVLFGTISCHMYHLMPHGLFGTISCHMGCLVPSTGRKVKHCCTVSYHWVIRNDDTISRYATSVYPALCSQQLKVKVFASEPRESLCPYDSPNVRAGSSRPRTVSLSDILVTSLCLAHTHTLLSNTISLSDILVAYTHAYVIPIKLLFWNTFRLPFTCNLPPMNVVKTYQ